MQSEEFIIAFIAEIRHLENEGVLLLEREPDGGNTHARKIIRYLMKCPLLEDSWDEWEELFLDIYLSLVEKRIA